MLKTDIEGRTEPGQVRMPLTPSQQNGIVNFDLNSPTDHYLSGGVATC
jgi:hypothetical protein